MLHYEWIIETNGCNNGRVTVELCKWEIICEGLMGVAWQNSISLVCIYFLQLAERCVIDGMKAHRKKSNSNVEECYWPVTGNLWETVFASWRHMMHRGSRRFVMLVPNSNSLLSVSRIKENLTRTCQRAQEEPTESGVTLFNRAKRCIYLHL